LRNKKGLKFAQGKIRYDLIPPEALKQVAAAFTFGSLKYEPENWKNLTEQDAVASIMRHVEAHRSGQLIDPDSGVAHLGCVMAQACFVLWYRRAELNEKFDFSGVAERYAKLKAEAKKR
jgi:hypothetical protein